MQVLLLGLWCNLQAFFIRRWSTHSSGLQEEGEPWGGGWRFWCCCSVKPLCPFRNQMRLERKQEGSSDQLLHPVWIVVLMACSASEQGHPTKMARQAEAMNEQWQWGPSPLTPRTHPTLHVNVLFCQQQTDAERLWTRMTLRENPTYLFSFFTIW